MLPIRRGPRPRRVLPPVREGVRHLEPLYRIASTAGAPEGMPVSFEEVLRVIHASLEAGNPIVIARHAGLQPQAEARDARVLTCGWLEIDTVARQVRCHGRSLDVSEREFRLFESLAEDPSRACSYRELWDAVWGGAYYGDSSPLRSLVKRARRKAPPAISGAEIESVRGYGFRLVVRRLLTATSAAPAKPSIGRPHAETIGEAAYDEGGETAP